MTWTTRTYQDGAGASRTAYVYNDGTADRAAHVDFDDQYEIVAASSTDQALGGTGAIGDYLKRLIIIPTATSPVPVVSIKDGAGSAITLFTGSASTVPGVAIVIDLGIRSMAGAWKVTTSGNASAIGIGSFTA